MKPIESRGFFPAVLLFAVFWGALPVLIADPDYPDSFTVVARPRNRNALGVVTKNGWPVFPTTDGAIIHTGRQGEALPGPTAPWGYSLPDITAGNAEGSP